MKNFQCLILFLVTVLFQFSCKAQDPGESLNIENKPNVLFISIDDLNDWIEPMGGHPQAITPNLTKFGDEGVVFKNAYCASPSCNPSRTALLTGKHPYVTGLYNNPQIWRHVLPNETTLPGYFKKFGYWTGGAGKIFHNNMPDSVSWNDYYPSLTKHFPDYYLPDFDSASSTKIFTKQDNEIREDDPKGITMKMPPFNRSYIAFDWFPLPYETEETGDYSSVKWTIEQLQKRHDKPFFLACGLYRPHLPWYVPQKYYDKFPIKDIQLPKVVQDDWKDLPQDVADRFTNTRYHQEVIKEDQWKYAVQGYLASINYADDLVGQLLEALRNSDYADNTIVVLFSDHGWQLGEKAHWRKFALWENVIKSVLMIKTPGQAKMGAITKNVSLVDIFPTLTELADLPPKEGVTGRSLVPLLQDSTTEWDYPVITMLGDNRFSVRKDQWHYIYHNRVDEELYNLENDPEEWINLAALPPFEKNIKELRKYIPAESEVHELVKTDGLRWADVLSGKTNLYQKRR